MRQMNELSKIVAAASTFRRRRMLYLSRLFSVSQEDIDLALA